MTRYTSWMKGIAMGVNLSGRSFLKLLDFSTEEIEYLLKLAKNFKDMKRAGVPHRYLEGKNIALLFQKTSTRTRCSFEVGGHDLGMGVTYLDPKSSQMGKKESIEDTARVLGRMFDGIEFRGYAHADVEELAANACPSGTGSPPSGIPRRCSPTCSPSRRTSTTTSRVARSSSWATARTTWRVPSWSFALSSA